MLMASEGSTREPIPAETYQAVAYAIYDLGTQYSEVFGKASHKAVVIWELPELRIEIEKDGEKLNLPRVISKQYTLSLGDKANLRKDLESWRGKAFTPEELKGFDIHRLIGANCMLQIIHKSRDGKTYANISALMPRFKQLPNLEPENPTVVYTLTDGEPPENTPKWIVELIHNSQEWKDAHGVHEEEPPPYDPERDGDSQEVPF